MKRAKILAAFLVLCLAGCYAPGTYQVQQHARWVGVALTSETLVTVQHDYPTGLYVRVRGREIPVRVTRRENYGAGHSLLWLEAEPGYELDLQPGDSGSPVALVVERAEDMPPWEFR